MGYTEMHKTAILVLFNIVLFSFIYWAYHAAKNKPYRVHGNNHAIGSILIYIFSVFAFWGNDWFHIYNFYPYLQAGDDTHFEDVYVWIASNIASNYYIFRIIIWGLGQFFLYATFKRMAVCLHLQLYMFVVFGLIWFSYARVSLAMAMMFYGISVLYHPYKTKIISYLLGIGLIVASFFFHKSAIFGIGIIACSILSSILKRRAIFFFIILIPVLILITPKYITYFIDVETDDQSLSTSIYSAQNYLIRDTYQTSIMSSLLKNIEHLIYIITAYLCIRVQVSKKYCNIPHEIAIFMRIVLFTVLFSIPFIFDIGFNTYVISERFFRFCFIPTSIIIAYFWQNKIFEGWTRWTLRLGICMTVLSLSYSAYCVIY